MKLNRFRRACAAPLVIAGLGGCATTGGYAEFDGTLVARANDDEAQLRVMGVDGRLELQPLPTARLEPGKRQLLLVSERVEWNRKPTARNIELAVAPCKRYEMVAKHDNDRPGWWTPFLKQVSDIPGCADAATAASTAASAPTR